MNAATALRLARDAGIYLRVDGDDLVLEASAPPPDAVLDLLSSRKADLIRLLSREAQNDWSEEDWLALFEERSAIAEFDGGSSRSEAEALAFECCVAEWLNRNPVVSPPDRCLECGEPDQPNEPLLPFGAQANGCAWLHKHCWSGWHQARTAQAFDALLAMGIEA